MKSNNRIKKIWAIFIVIVFAILITFILYEYLKIPPAVKTVTDKDINQIFQFEGNKIAINLDLLKKLNSSVYYDFIHHPLPCNETGTYDGFVVPLPTTYETFNNDCFRGTKDYTIPKPNGTYRIVMIGDSFFFGAGVNDNETLSSYLEKDLPKNYEVLNLGNAGYNTKAEVERLKFKGLKYHPDLVIVGYVSNDFEDTKTVQNLDHYLIKMLLAQNMSMEKAWDIRLKIDYLKYFPFNSTFKDSVEQPLGELNELSKEYNFSVIVISYPLSYYLDEKDYKNLLKKICLKNKFPFYYLRDEIGYQLKGKWILDPKDVHPTSYANERTAEFLKDIILKQKNSIK